MNVLTPVAVSEWDPRDWRMNTRYELEMLMPDEGEDVVFCLSRFFRRDEKQKSIFFSAKEAEHVLDALVYALKCRPETLLDGEVPAGLVDVPHFATLWIGWAPWWWERDVALIIRQQWSNGSCAIAVRREYAPYFVGWLMGRLMPHTS